MVNQTLATSSRGEGGMLTPYWLVSFDARSRLAQYFSQMSACRAHNRYSHSFAHSGRVSS
jgi:hypothetical protein